MSSQRLLTSAQVEEFQRQGYLAPIKVLGEAEAASVGEHLDALMDRTRNLADPAARHKPHLYAKWASDLVRHRRVLDAVEDLIGPNLLVWRAVFFVKPAGDPHYIAWHQDSVYWGLSSDDVVTAWIALTDRRQANGCLRVVPGSHRQPEARHTIHAAGDNILVRGQSAAASVAEDKAQDVELFPGEMSLHHVRMLHGSRANLSSRPRVGLAIRYLAPHV